MTAGLRQADKSLFQKPDFFTLFFIIIGYRQHLRVVGNSMESTISEGDLITYKRINPKSINLKILNELDRVLKIKDAKAVNSKGLLRDKSFLVTGKLNGVSRAEVKSLIEENSGITVSTVSNKLNYLIVGEKPTRRKLESAKELKIKIINQEDFLKMLNKTS